MELVVQCRIRWQDDDVKD